MDAQLHINRPDPTYKLVQRWQVAVLFNIECHTIKLTFPFEHYNQSPWLPPPPPGLTTSRLFTGVNGLTPMAAPLPQETQDIKDRGEPRSLPEADVHTPGTAGENIPTHLQRPLLGPEHGR